MAIKTLEKVWLDMPARVEIRFTTIWADDGSWLAIGLEF